MSKKIIHFKIPLNEYGIPLVSYEDVLKHVKYIKASLPQYCKIIFSPYEIQIEGNIIKITQENIDNVKVPNDFLEKFRELVEKFDYTIQIIK